MLTELLQDVYSHHALREMQLFTPGESGRADTKIGRS